MRSAISTGAQVFEIVREFHERFLGISESKLDDDDDDQHSLIPTWRYHG
jgi:hypothetical protein